MSDLKKVRLGNGDWAYDCDVFQSPDAPPLKMDESIIITGNLYLGSNNVLSTIQTGGHTFLRSAVFCNAIFSSGSVFMEDCASARKIFAHGSVHLRDHCVAGDILSGSGVFLKNSCIVNNVHSLGTTIQSHSVTIGSIVRP